VLTPGCPIRGAGAEVAGPVLLPGALPSMDRAALRPGSTWVSAPPGAGTAGALTLGDVGAAVLGAVTADPAVPPPPRALPPLELAPPAPVPWAMAVGIMAVGILAKSQLKASRVKKRMEGVLIVSAGCLNRTNGLVRCSGPRSLIACH
jgi:hypothetical protein